MRRNCRESEIRNERRSQMWRRRKRSKGRGRVGARCEKRAWRKKNARS